MTDTHVMTPRGVVLSTYLIQYGGRAPADPSKNTEFHQSLIDDMAAEADRMAWPGGVFASYGRREGYVSIAIAPGNAKPTLEDLRIFREEQRKAAEAERDLPEQGSMFA